MASNELDAVLNAVAPWSEHWTRQVFKAGLDSKFCSFLNPPTGGMMVMLLASGMVDATNSEPSRETETGAAESKSPQLKLGRKRRELFTLLR